jgi:hypothetical protein
MLMEIQIFLNKVTPILTKYLNDVLPKICGNWWEECVLGKLSENQKRQIKIGKINSLELLDLAALLRLFNNNWQEISNKKNLSFEVRNYANELLSDRNKFAHLSNQEPNKEDIDRSADTIQRFIKALDESNYLILEIKNYRNSLKLFSVVSSKVEAKIETTRKKIEVPQFKDEPIGKLVQRYVLSILEYCFSEDETELINLLNKDSSKRLFGINYPFMIEVSKSSEKIDRYWKTKYSFNNRHFFITSEWYKWNREKFINYLNNRNLLDITDNQKIISKYEDSIIKGGKKFQDVNFEIEKVHKRIPKWFRSPNQINHKILMKYLELRGVHEFVFFSELEHNLQKIETFKENYNSMKNSGERNHARIFDEDNGKVYLWEPVKEFILKYYKSIQ